MYGSQLGADISSRGKLAMARDIFDEQGRSVLLLCNGFRPGAVEKHPSRHRIPPFSSTPNKKWSSPSSQLSWNRKTLLCQTANWPSSFEGLINASNSVIKMKCITFSFPRLPRMSDHSVSLASMIFINYDSFYNEVRSSKSENWVSIFFFLPSHSNKSRRKDLKLVGLWAFLFLDQVHISLEICSLYFILPLAPQCFPGATHAPLQVRLTDFLAKLTNHHILITSPLK